MELLRLELTDFRCFEHRVFDLTDRMLLIGPTGAGKSSVIDALAWVLTGRCRGVDGKGSGQQNLIRDGAQEATAKLRIKGFPVEIVRSVNAKGATSNPKPDAVQQKLGAGDDELTCLIYGRAFFELHHADAKRLIMRILDVTINADDIPGLDVAPGTRLDLDALEMHFKDMFTRRAGAKRALEMHHVPEAPKVQNIADGAVGKIDDLKTAATAARKAANLARDTWSKAQAKREASRAEQQRALGLAQNIAKIRSQLEAQTQMHVETVDARGALGDLEIIPLFDPATNGDIHRLKRTVESIEHHDPKRGCVLDPGNIPCLTLASEFKGKVKDLRQQITTLQEQQAAITAEAGEVNKRNAARNEQDRQVQMHSNQIATFTARLKDAEASEANVVRLEQEQTTLDREELDARKAAGEAETADATATTRYEAALRYYASTEGRTEALRKRAELEDEVGKLEKLVERLGPTGIRVEVLQAAVSEFETLINSALEAFGFRLLIQADPWVVQIGRMADAGDVVPDSVKPFVVYSEGERIVIALAFQQALAVLTQIDFLCVDASESVTGDFRGTLTGLVMNSPVKQILMAMGKAPDDPVPAIEGLQVVGFQMAEQPA